MTIRLPRPAGRGLLIPRETWRESTPLSDVPDVVAGIPMSAGYREYRVPKYGVPVNSYRRPSRIDGDRGRREGGRGRLG